MFPPVILLYVVRLLWPLLVPAFVVALVVWLRRRAWRNLVRAELEAIRHEVASLEQRVGRLEAAPVTPIVLTPHAEAVRTAPPPVASTAPTPAPSTPPPVAHPRSRFIAEPPLAAPVRPSPAGELREQPRPPRILEHPAGDGGRIASDGHAPRPTIAEEQWEAVIGESWLNKLGVLVFVIGVALFVAYAVSELGPAGRVAVGFGVGVAMLVGGVVVERWERYVAFGYGLIGGGWAALYFTAYAAHGISAARIIDDPVVATLLLGLVALGMLVHSLRYRSQVVTGLAYFVAFATLAISPLTGFAIVASVPLAASLLVVARRFVWQPMVIAGVVATYGFYLAASPALPTVQSGFIGAQAALVTYWLLFEGFDLIDLGRAAADRGILAGLFPINTCAFIGLSLLKWSAFSPATIDLFLAAAAGAFALDSVLRALIRPPSLQAAEHDSFDRAVKGGYECSVTVAVVLATAAVFRRFGGFEINVALLTEAEVLALAGLALGQVYLQTLGAGVLGLALGKLLIQDVGAAGAVSIAGASVHSWTPIAILTCGALYLNRLLPLTLRRAYGFPATFVAVIVIACEFPIDYCGLGWLILGGALFEVGMLAGADDLRMQGYVSAFFGSAVMLTVGIFGWPGFDPARQPLALLAGALITYGAALEARPWRGRLGEEEGENLRDFAVAAGSALVTTMLWYELPAALVAPAWGLLALILIEAGFALQRVSLRGCGWAVAALAYGRLFMFNFAMFGETFGLSHRLLTVAPVMLLFYHLARRRNPEAAEPATALWERSLARACLYAATFLLMVLIRFEAGVVLAVVGWAALAVVLLLLGVHRGDRDLRWQSYVVALMIFARGWGTNFYTPGEIAGIPVRIITAALAIAALYACELISPREGRADEERSTLGSLLAQLDRHMRIFFSLLATLLLAALLYHEVSGAMLTEAWALQGMALLGAGFALRERVLRLYGLAMLGICVVKIFAYDLSALETLARILSFVVLGLVLLAVSFIYTRFHGQLRRYL